MIIAAGCPASTSFLSSSISPSSANAAEKEAVAQAESIPSHDLAVVVDVIGRGAARRAGIIQWGGVAAINVAQETVTAGMVRVGSDGLGVVIDPYGNPTGAWDIDR